MQLNVENQVHSAAYSLAGLFPVNTYIDSKYSFVAIDQLLPEFPLFLFRLVPKFQYFKILFWIYFLQ